MAVFCDSFKWIYLSAFVCVLNITFIVYFTEYLHTLIIKIPEISNYRQHSQTTISNINGSATSGNLFRMDDKIHTFEDRNYNKINIESRNKGKKELRFDKQCKSEYWIVLTTIFNVSSAILDYNNINNWCTVIAGDKKSINKEIYNKYLNREKVIYLDVNEQDKIFTALNAFSIYDIIPFNHFGRKNIGFLYAIMNGARYIYDTDDDNKVIEPYNKNGIPILGNTIHNNMGFKIKEISDKRINDLETFNIFLLWSNTFIWPRGYDISVLTESFKWHKTVNLTEITTNYNSGEKSNPFIIQQWLSNIEPDYDALARLIGKNIDFKSEDFTMEYIFEINENNNFALSVANHLYIPFNAQMTIWDYRSFLFLYLPITVHGRVSDIWRSYFADTVMHILNLNNITNWKLLYCPVLVNQYRNSHNYLADFQSELPLYLQTNQLLKFLHSFAKRYKINSLVNVNIGQILLDLYISLYEYNIIQMDDVKGIYSWIHDIVNKIGWNHNKW